MGNDSFVPRDDNYFTIFNPSKNLAEIVLYFPDSCRLHVRHFDAQLRAGQYLDAGIKPAATCIPEGFWPLDGSAKITYSSKVSDDM